MFLIVLGAVLVFILAVYEIRHRNWVSLVLSIVVISGSLLLFCFGFRIMTLAHHVHTYKALEDTAALIERGRYDEVTQAYREFQKRLRTRGEGDPREIYRSLYAELSQLRRNERPNE